MKVLQEDSSKTDLSQDEGVNFAKRNADGESIPRDPRQDSNLFPHDLTPISRYEGRPSPIPGKFSNYEP